MKEVKRGGGTSRKQIQGICLYCQQYFFNFAGWRGWGRLIILTFEIANVVLRGDLNICRDLFLIYMGADTETVVYAWLVGK